MGKGTVRLENILEDDNLPVIWKKRTDWMMNKLTKAVKYGFVLDVTVKGGRRC